MALPKGVPLPDKYNIVSCSCCGFCYADTSATQTDYDVYYSDYNNYSGQGANKAFQTTFSPIRTFLEKHTEKSSAILDVGFGKGELLKRLGELGYTELTGIDPSQYSVDHLKRNGIQAYKKSVYDDPGWLSGNYDLVFLMSVIEHLLDPKIAVVQATKYLKNGGFLIVDIPDYSMCNKVELPIPNQFNQEHINYFSRISFERMLQGSPLQLLYTRQIEIESGFGLGSEFSRIFMLQKVDGTMQSTARRDFDTKKSIEQYLDYQEGKHENMAMVLADFCKRQVPLIIWGAGALTMSILETTELRKCNVVAVVDGNPLKEGGSIGRWRVNSPECIRNLPDAVIVVSAMKFRADIRKMIAEYGFSNPVIDFE